MSALRAPPRKEAARLRRRGGGKAQAAAAAATAVSEGDDGKAQAGEFRTIVLPSALVLLSSNLCRIAMPVALVPLAAHFGWSAGTVGVIGSSFLWGYMATQLLGGALADAIGGKRALAIGMALWFGATGLLPLALSAKAALVIPALCTLRAVVGAGQGAMMSSMQQVVATHIPQRRRATALGAVYGGFHMGNIVGLVLCPLIIAWHSVEASFLAVSLAGVPVMACWLALVPQPPPPASGEKGAGSGAGLLALLRSSPAPWAIVAATFVNHFAYFLFLNWMPAFFVAQYGVSLQASAKLSLAPWVACAVVSSLAGVVADSAARMPGMTLTRVRKFAQCGSFLGTALCLTVLGTATDPRVAMACFVGSFASISLGQAGFVANTSDVAPPRLVGRLFGLANTFGSFAGILSTSLAGYLGFEWIFKVTALVLVGGAAFYARFASAERAIA